MAASPDWKVYKGNEYIASCKSPYYAAMIIAGLGEGTIRYGHSKKAIKWNEGAEEIPASESYDVVAGTCYERLFG